MTEEHRHAGFFSDLDVGPCIYKENVPIETFNISIQSTEFNQQCDNKIISIEGKKLW